ncbi:MAG: nicotinamide mononucleotide transporter [Bacteroidales bacterium]|nr:nicotinamide mononucleotide transporter [Bacteroidales bacterium]
MDEKQFNRWFSAFILIGMSVALVLATAIKLGGQAEGRGLLLLAAFGSLMGVLATVSSANGRIITFLFGLLDVAIYGAMCLMNWRDGGSGLGNAVLHFVYFVPMQFVGFAQWKRRGSNEAGQVRARRLDGRQWAWIGLALVVSTGVLYGVIAHFDKSAADGFLKMAVVLDVLPLVCNIFGQALMSTAYREQWFFWIGVNVFSIWMWARSLATGGGSYAVIYIIKYSFYLINSLNGLRIWHNLSKKEDVCK